MKVIVNGKERNLPANATLKEALEGEHYVKGTLVSVHMSTERLVKESEDWSRSPRTSRSSPTRER